MATLKETSALKECAIVKGISYEIFGRGMVYLEAKTRKDISYGITVILEANPTFTLIWISTPWMVRYRLLYL